MQQRDGLVAERIDGSIIPARLHTAEDLVLTFDAHHSPPAMAMRVVTQCLIEFAECVQTLSHTKKRIDQKMARYPKRCSNHSAHEDRIPHAIGRVVCDRNM